MSINEGNKHSVTGFLHVVLSSYKPTKSDSGYPLGTQGKASNLFISHLGKYKLGSRLLSGTSIRYSGKLIRYNTSLPKSDGWDNRRWFIIVCLNQMKKIWQIVSFRGRSESPRLLRYDQPTQHHMCFQYRMLVTTFNFEMLTLEIGSSPIHNLLTPNKKCSTDSHYKA